MYEIKLEISSWYSGTASYCENAMAVSSRPAWKSLRHREFGGKSIRKCLDGKRSVLTLGSQVLSGQHTTKKNSQMQNKNYHINSLFYTKKHIFYIKKTK